MGKCIEKMKYEIVLKNARFKESSDFILKNSEVVYYVEPGFKVFDRRLIGVPPIPIGVGNDYIMLTYVKPCYGAFVLKLPRDDEELEKIKVEDKKYNEKHRKTRYK
jgi:hypothetical protein